MTEKIQKGVTLSDEQVKYIEDKCLDLTRFVQKAINNEMRVNP